MRLRRWLPTTLATGTAVSAESAAPAAESAASAAESTATLFAGLGLRLVHAERASVEFVSVEGIDRGLRLCGVGHRDEAESLAATGHAIGHDTNGGNFAELRERRLESIVGGRVCEVTNIDFHLDSFLLVFRLAGKARALAASTPQILPILPPPRQWLTNNNFH
jgi:hypothetical protein